MKKIIVGVRRDVELLRSIEYFLDDDCEIIGYHRIVPRIANPLFCREFYTVKQLKSVSFDYIVSATLNELDMAKFIESLSVLNCDKKIVIPVILKANGREKRTLDVVSLIDDCEGGYHSIVMGLSHAMRNIDTSVLTRNVFNLSSGGLDIYYLLKLLQYGLMNGKFAGIKQAWLMFPYYYFDYDQSRSYHQYKVGQIFSTHRLDDWHNASKVTQDRDVVGSGVRNYIANYRLFGRKMSDRYRYRFDTRQYLTVCKDELGKGELLQSFWRDHPKTIVENRVLFRKLITLLKKHDVKITLIPPPLFVSVLNDENLERLKVLEERFYSIVNEELSKLGVSVQIKDTTRLFADRRELFLDVVHLNTAGSIAYSKYINDELLC